MVMGDSAVSLEKMIINKANIPSKALIIRLNLIFLVFFFLVYAALLLRPSSSLYFYNAASLVRCSLRECHHKVERGVKMQAEFDGRNPIMDNAVERKSNLSKLEVASFMNEMGRGLKIGMINMEDVDVSELEVYGELIQIHFKRVSENLEWKDLFPEWIDEEEDNENPWCPEIPMPELRIYKDDMDVIVAKLPCKYPDEGWSREVFRLQMHLVLATMAVNKGKRDWNRRTKVLLWSKCRPMMEIFRCDDLIRHEGNWWLYQPAVARLEQKLMLPVGSCNLALPLWGQGIHEVYDTSKIESAVKNPRREAYATVLHSSEAYVCGAITLGQSLQKTGTKRDLLILVDNSITDAKRQALVAAGWTIRLIKRIRNRRAEKDSYNEYNYSKFRLWQLTDYHKVIFIDSDIIVLRNLDLLFYFPQMSATGNDVWIFNSGIMVIEPSNCTFKLLMKLQDDIVSYNGGDQGFLNEVFVWWHRLPRRVNFLKNFWANTSVEASVKNHLFAADPPKLYSIHYLGLKPWLCYRDYDCNWDIDDQRVYASDVAHERWWKLHDAMDENLQKHCRLTKRRRIELDWDRKKAREAGFSDEHWRINITDPRRTLLT
ncbi:UDP-glucuronate:xylan alpha-glucuronosyltransferase 2 [Carica papaya]|uniref:UDP-glucuronate:xylan alpha-glucuronosyltransferase 2 n=1 Tax=Carica papaya TaxID=3649 RepID=UPI000B8D173B|nr:UDP-glucuronate:xylan alpha-glucuronosyltransferase 2 [Carica papaya]